MGWLFDEEELKSKQDYIDKLNELSTYRKLESEPFDFGEGTIINDGEFKLGSEDAYYEMDIQTLEEIINAWEEYEDAFIQAKASLSIEGMFLNEKEEEIIRKRMYDEITEEEFLKLAEEHARRSK